MVFGVFFVPCQSSYWPLHRAYWLWLFTERCACCVVIRETGGGFVLFFFSLDFWGSSLSLGVVFLCRTDAALSWPGWPTESWSVSHLFLFLSLIHSPWMVACPLVNCHCHRTTHFLILDLILSLSLYFFVFIPAHLRSPYPFFLFYSSTNRFRWYEQHHLFLSIQPIRQMTSVSHSSISIA